MFDVLVFNTLIVLALFYIYILIILQERRVVACISQLAGFSKTRPDLSSTTSSQKASRTPGRKRTSVFPATLALSHQLGLVQDVFACGVEPEQGQVCVLARKLNGVLVVVGIVGELTRYWMFCVPYDVIVGGSC